MTGREPGPTLLVGCGALGIGLGERLISAGTHVTGLRRGAAALPASFSAVAADLRHPLPQELPAFASVVITLPPDASGEPVYRHALGHLAAALPARPDRVVFVSSTRVFEGRPGPQPLTESDAPAPLTARAAELLDGEAAAAELLGAMIVRPSGIYGPGRDSLIRRVIAGVPVDHTRRTNRIHEADLVALLEALLREEAPPALVHATDDAPAPLGDVVAHIAMRLGVALPPHVDPESGGGTVLDGSRAKELLGALQYPTYREGYDELLSGRAAR